MDYGLDREFFGMSLGLDRTRAVLKGLGNPERQFRSIHIAGTNGKGSTAAMIASILREAGYRVGLYTSPHLIDVRERIQINGEMIGEGEFRKLSDEIMRYEGVGANPCVRPNSGQTRGSAPTLSYFEFLTAIGFLYFARQKVDIAVLEVGLGGRLDATNVITPEVSVITNIALDHTQHLGDTLEKIAFEKAGIVKKGVPVVCGEEAGGALEIIKSVAEKIGTVPIYFLPLTPALRLAQGAALSPKGEGERTVGLLGTHQRKNAALAAQVVHILNEQGKFKISEEALERGLQNVRWPGRLEYLEWTGGERGLPSAGLQRSETRRREPSRQDPSKFLLDGAHNPSALQSLAAYLKENHANDKIRLILGMMADKDIRANLAAILPLASEIIVTAPALKRALAPEALAEIVRGMTDKPVRVAANVRDALMLSPSPPAFGGTLSPKGEGKIELTVVTGSLYLVGEALKILSKKYFS